jgi:hypothetical protein
MEEEHKTKLIEAKELGHSSIRRLARDAGVELSSEAAEDEFVCNVLYSPKVEGSLHFKPMRDGFTYLNM